MNTYENLQIVWSQFFTDYIIFIYIWSNSNIYWFIGIQICCQQIQRVIWLHLTICNIQPPIWWVIMKVILNYLLLPIFAQALVEQSSWAANSFYHFHKRRVVNTGVLGVKYWSKRKEPESWLGWFFNSKLGNIGRYCISYTRNLVELKTRTIGLYYKHIAIVNDDA